MSISEVREYWDRRPCNIRHSAISVNEDPLVYSQQVTARKYFVEPHILAFANFKQWQEKRVLELGCGIGTDTLSFARAGAYVTAFDISDNSLDIAWKRAEAEGLDSQIWPRYGNMENLRHVLVQGDYDLVYSFGAIHHTPHPRRAIQTAYNYLSPSGEFRLMLYHRKSWKVLLILLRNWKQFLRGKSVDQIVAMESEAQSGCPITWTFTKQSARALLRFCGFEIESMEVAHIFPYRVEDYINYCYIKKWLWRWMPARLFHWLERHIGWHLLITARKA